MDQPRARAVRFDRYGGREVLHVDDVPMPVPAAGEVLVEVRAAGTNPGEAAIRSGAMEEVFPATFPCGQGSDLAGVVTALGEGVSALAVGDEVLGCSWTRSSHATHAAVPVTQLVREPAGVSWEVAGSLFVAGSTAHGALPVAYGEGLAERLRAAAPDGVDAFIDLLGPQYVQLAADLGVRPDRIETIVAFAKAQELGAQTRGSADASGREVLAELAGLVADGTVEVPIAATFLLDRVADAFAELEQRHTRGKIVLVP